MKKWMQKWTRSFQKWWRYDLLTWRRSLGGISIERAWKIRRGRFFEFQNKKKFLRWKNGFESEQESLKNGEDMNYWLGEEAWEVFQSKEREKLGEEGFLSFGMKKMDILMKMHFEPNWVKPKIFTNWKIFAKWNSNGKNFSIGKWNLIEK